MGDQMTSVGYGRGRQLDTSLGHLELWKINVVRMHEFLVSALAETRVVVPTWSSKAYV